MHLNVFSIQDASTRKVIGYGQGILLKSVKMIVGKAGRNKVKNTNNRNVHAYIVGTFEGLMKQNEEYYEEVTYNPYFLENFVIKKTGEPIYYSIECLCINNKCFIRSLNSKLKK